MSHKLVNQPPVQRSFFRKIDAVVALAIVLFAAAGWLAYRNAHQGESAVAEIYVGGEVIRTVDLSTYAAGEFTLPEVPAVVFLVDTSGGIRFVSSDCPDQVCVRTGRIAMPGAFAACLPNDTLIRLVPRDGGGDVDIVIGG